MKSDAGSKKRCDKDHGPGRPTLFRPGYVEQARKLSRIGATLHELGDFLGVDERTVRRWRHIHPDFDQAIVIGAEAANRRVEASLYQMAIGYEREEEEIKVIDGNIVRVKVKRFMPPNASAAIFWAKAKMGWRDDGHSEQVGSNSTTAQVSEAPPVDIRDTARKVAYLLRLGGNLAEK